MKSYVGVLAGASAFRTVASVATCRPATFSAVRLDGGIISSIEAKLATVNVAAGVQPTNGYIRTTSANATLCQVTVRYGHPGWNDTINTWVWLPVRDWNGRLMGLGGGGLVTGSPDTLAKHATERYALVTTDGGHAGTAPTSSWAVDRHGDLNWPNLLDFAGVALDDAATLGKVVSKAFYGSRPARSYFNGCSSGGRQGHMMAQNYPTQYDGILASCPAINWDRFVPAGLWGAILMYSVDYFPPPCEQEAITQAAIDACDPLDGLEDGLILQPDRCTFDPLTVVGKEVRCRSPPNATMRVSEKAARIVAKIWEGPRTASGNFKWHGWTRETPLNGSSGTNCSAASLTDCRPVNFYAPVDWLRYFLQPDHEIDLATVTPDDYSAFMAVSRRRFGAVIGTSNPDLAAFRARGGKMITWHGTADDLIPYQGTVDYYQRVLRHDPDAADYYRFFTAPGAGHCHGGPGWMPGSSFQALVDWVELGRPPRTLSAHTDARDRAVELCAYPSVLTYVGGNASLPSSFQCRDQ